MPIPLTQLPRDTRRAAKEHLVAGMNAGLSWRAAAAAAGITTSEATAHRLRRRVRHQGDRALSDDWHGVAYKLPSAVRQWLVTYCQAHPHTPSHALQTVICTQFDVLISVGYLNQLSSATLSQWMATTHLRAAPMCCGSPIVWKAIRGNISSMRLFWSAIAKGVTSMPSQRRPSFSAAASAVPQPQKGSREILRCGSG